ncbi:class I adenylate-forming enzyme family protein [Paremcibacter congregatus]|nr:class I adenylate-forming enzyme family protein [Paremcibacter congregatus]
MAPKFPHKPPTPPLLDRIFDYVAYHAQKKPAQDALVMDNVRYNYQELSHKIDDIARGLLAHGIKKGDRVATLSPPHPDFFLTFLAAASVGAIWIGLNPRYKINEYRYLLEDSGISFIFTFSRFGNREFLPELEQLKREFPAIKEIVILDEINVQGETSYLSKFIQHGKGVNNTALRMARESVDKMDPAAIIYTSGTTGAPKGTMISHRGLCVVFRNQISYWGTTPLRMLNFLPINHIGSLGDAACFSLIAGGTQFMMEKFDPEKSMQIMQDEKITLWAGVPTTFQMCLALNNFSEFDLSHIQLIAFGGASPSRELVDKLLFLQVPFSNTYGQTETTSTVTYVAPTFDLEEVTGTIGKSVPEYEVRIMDKSGQEADIGETGEIQVRGTFVMLGYWNRPEATAEAFTPEGWLHTGDSGQKLPNGNFKYIGRIKEMFKSGGYNIYPLEIEAIIEKHPDIEAAVVVSVADELYGETGVAFVQAVNGRVINIDHLSRHCSDLLANYKIPKRFIVLDELPVLPIGKFDRKLLKKQAKNLIPH